MTSRGVPFTIRVELGPNLARLAPDAATLGPVTRYAEDLAQDLGLPLEATLVVAPAAAESAPASLRISLDKRACRVAQAASSATGSPETLISRINAALHANRELFLAPAVLDAVWSRGGRPGPCPTEVREGLIALVSLGLQVAAVPGLLGSEATGLPTDAAFEKAVTQAAGRWRILVSPTVHKALRFADGAGTDPESVEQQLRAMNDAVYYELGLVFPRGTIEPDARLSGDEFRIQVNDLRLPGQLGLAADEFLVNDTVDRLTLLSIKGREAVSPDNGSEATIIAGATDAETCKHAGLTVWNRQEFLIYCAKAVVRQSAAAFLTTDVVEFCNAKLSGAFPVLVDRASQAFSPIFLTRVLRHLLHEGISVRDLRTILETLLAVSGRTTVDVSKFIVFFHDTDAPGVGIVGFGNGREALAREHAETVRMSLKRSISYKYTRGGNTLVVYLVDPAIEKRLSDPAPLAAAEHSKLISAVFDEVGGLPPTAHNPVLLTNASIRARLRREIETEFPALDVLSYQELVPDVNIQPISRITFVT